MPFQMIPTVRQPIPRTLEQQLIGRQLSIIQQQAATNYALGGLAERLGVPVLANPLAGIEQLITNPQTWFNVVGVLIAIVLIVIGVIYIARQT